MQSSPFVPHSLRTCTPCIQVLELLARIDSLKSGLAGREREAAAAHEAREVAEQRLRQATLQLEEAQSQVRVSWDQQSVASAAPLPDHGGL